MLLNYAGGVYHFDAIGAQYSADGWTECIAVSVISANNTNQCHLWDRLIVEFYTSYQQSHTVYVFCLPLSFSSTENMRLIAKGAVYYYLLAIL